MRKKTQAPSEAPTRHGPDQGEQEALADVSTRGRAGLKLSHARVLEGLEPIAAHLEVLRLQFHAATASASVLEAQQMEDAAALCDRARTHLDTARTLIDGARDTASLEAA